MNLVASMIVSEVERDRYLVPCVAHLLTYCDEVVMLFDGDGEWSKDLIGAWGSDGDRVVGVHPGAGHAPFLDHEGQARQRLLDATLARSPSHVLAIDADEFVTDPSNVRTMIETDASNTVWAFCMQEVWGADRDGLTIRQDGGWNESDVRMLWRVDVVHTPMIWDRPLACGRIPVQASRGAYGCAYSCNLHFGWANTATRQKRYDRYAVADGGRYHAKSHLDSILYPDDQCTLSRRDWPDTLEPYRDVILAHIEGGSSS